MKMKKVKRRIISLVLTVAIVCTGYGVSTLADTTRNNLRSEKIEEVSVEKVVTQIKEIKTERTANSNTYLMSDGSKRLEIYSEAIRYKENGKWVNYDSSLTSLDNVDIDILEDKLNFDSKDYVKVNSKGDTKQYFPKKLHEEGIVMNKDNYTVSLTPIINYIVDSYELDNSEVLWNQAINDSIMTPINSAQIGNTTTIQAEETSVINENMSIDEYIPEVDENKIVYSSENSSIQYEYISLNNGVKENIILLDKPDTNIFRFNFGGEKLN